MARSRRLDAEFINFRRGWVTDQSAMLKEVEFRGGRLKLDDSWADVKNVQIDPTGVLMRRGGSQRKGSGAPMASAAPVKHIVQYNEPDGTVHLLCITEAAKEASANAYRLVGTTWTTVTSGGPKGAVRDWSCTESDTVDSTVFAGSMIVVSSNRSDRPAYWDGGTSGYFRRLPAEAYYAKYVEAFKGHCFLGNMYESSVEKPGRIRWSAEGAFTAAGNWPATNFIDLEPDDGDEITGMHPMGDVLVVFKKHKIFTIHYVGGPLQFTYQRRHVGHGCIAGGSIVLLRNGLVYLGTDGFYFWNGGEPENISVPIRDKVTSIQYDYAKHTSGTDCEVLGQIWWSLPYDGDDTIASSALSATEPNTEVFVYDYNQKYWTRHNLHLCCLSSWRAQSTLTIGDLEEPFTDYTWAWDARRGQSGTNIPLGGTYRGTVVELDAGGKDASSALMHPMRAAPLRCGIDSWVKTRWLDFGEPIATKRLYRTTAFITPTGCGYSHGLDIRFKDDYAKESSGTLKSPSLSGTPSLKLIEKRVDWTNQFRNVQLKLGTNAYGTIGTARASNASTHGEYPFKLHNLRFEVMKKGRTGAPSYG